MERTLNRTVEILLSLMWGVAPHKIDAHMRDVQETRRNDYTTSQPHDNHVNVNGIIMVQ